MNETTFKFSFIFQYGKDLESAEERREREQQDLELAKEMAEDDDDGF